MLLKQMLTALFYENSVERGELCVEPAITTLGGGEDREGERSVAQECLL